MRHPRSQLVSSRILVGAGILVVTLAACANPSSTTALPSLTPIPSDSATGANIPRSPGPQPSETRSSTSTPVNRTPSSSPSPKPGSPSGTPAPSNSAPSSGSPAPSTSASSSPRPTRFIRPSPHPTTSPVPTTAELRAALLSPAELPGLGFEAERPRRDPTAELCWTAARSQRWARRTLSPKRLRPSRWKFRARYQRGVAPVPGQCR